MTTIEPITEQQRAELQFQKFIEQAKNWVEQVDAIEVNSIHDKAEMEEAKQLRLKLRTVRTDAEKLKKELKADALAYGRAIDQCYNTIVDTVKPLETKLLEKEKFAENLEKARIEKITFERLDRLRPYDVDGELGVVTAPNNLGEMSDEDFEVYLAGRKAIFEQRQQEEQDRIAMKQVNAKQIEMLSAENEQLKRDREQEQREFAEKHEREERERIEAEEHNRVLREAMAADIKQAEERLGELRELLPVLEWRDGKVGLNTNGELAQTCSIWIHKLSELKMDLEK